MHAIFMKNEGDSKSEILSHSMDPWNIEDYSEALKLNSVSLDWFQIIWQMTAFIFHCFHFRKGIVYSLFTVRGPALYFGNIWLVS